MHQETRTRQYRCTTYSRFHPANFLSHHLADIVAAALYADARHIAGNIVLSSSPARSARHPLITTRWPTAGFSKRAPGRVCTGTGRLSRAPLVCVTLVSLPCRSLTTIKACVPTNGRTLDGVWGGLPPITDPDSAHASGFRVARGEGRTTSPNPIPGLSDAARWSATVYQPRCRLEGGEVVPPPRLVPCGDVYLAVTLKTGVPTPSRYMRDRLPTLPTAQAGGAGPAQADGSGLPDHLITLLFLQKSLAFRGNVCGKVKTSRHTEYLLSTTA